jgi:hypothetical protein
METEFKEKTYEKYFSHEIVRLTNISFSPDQCDKNFLGFDDAFLLPFEHLLFIAPYVRSSRRLRRSGIVLRELDHLTEEAVKRMPPSVSISSSSISDRSVSGHGERASRAIGVRPTTASTLHLISSDS